MKESGRLEQILVNYKLMSPISFFVRRKILKSKRKTLSKILKIERIDSMFVSAAVYFNYLLTRLGFKTTLAGGAKAFEAAAVFSMIIIISSSLAIVYNYGKVSQFIIALTGVQEYQEGFILAANGDAKIIRDNKELPVIRAKDRLITKDKIITGANGTILFQMEKKTLVRIMPKSSGTVEIDVKAKTLYLSQGTVLCNVQDLAKNEKYKVVTANAEVVVVGTQFSVTNENGKTIITVIKGAVQAINLKNNESIQVDKGKTALITGMEIKLKDSEETEKVILQRFGKLEFMNNILEKNNKEMNDFQEAVQALDKEGEEDIKIITLEDIKQKYGKLEEIELYSGKRYTGAIISRGGIFSFITINGIKKIPAKDVKNIRIIQ